MRHVLRLGTTPLQDPCESQDHNLCISLISLMSEITLNNICAQHPLVEW
jgi:hypothetical protein